MPIALRICPSGPNPSASFTAQSVVIRSQEIRKNEGTKYHLWIRDKYRGAYYRHNLFLLYKLEIKNKIRRKYSNSFSLFDVSELWWTVDCFVYGSILGVVRRGFSWCRFFDLYCTNINDCLAFRNRKRRTVAPLYNRLFKAQIGYFVLMPIIFGIVFILAESKER